MSLPRTLGRVAAGAAAAGLATLGYTSLVERRWFALRRVEVPVLPAGAAPVSVLHLSDLHLTPRDRARQEWVAGLAELQPDLVVDTGDNLAHPDSVGPVLRCFDGLLRRPGVYVWGSNDYYAPHFKNPLTYFLGPSRMRRSSPPSLPWRELGAGFADAGWTDLTHRRHVLRIHGTRIGFRGTDDAHLQREDYAQVAGPVADEGVDVSIAVTHAPYRRLLDPMAADGHDLILAGHTHGGQVCVPLYGALVTNCDLDAARVKGLSQHTAGGHTSWLHVSGGLGTSPYAPFRLACRPEATLLTLVPR